MQFDETARIIQDSAESLLSDAYSFGVRENIRRAGGFDKKLWRLFADNGWLMASVPSADGGMGDNGDIMAALAQAMGGALLLEPWLGSAVLASRAIARAGEAYQRATWLPTLMDGSAIAALAYNEPQSRGFPDHIEATAQSWSRGYRLNGRKITVLGAPVSNFFVVAARTESAGGAHGGIGLFVVPASAGGVTCRITPLTDGRAAGEVTFDNVLMGFDAGLGDPDDGLPALEEVLAHGLVAQAADNVGAMDRCCALTAEHLRTRQQFGTSLGSFQVMQHRMADMAIALESSRSMLHWALSKLSVKPDLSELSGLKSYVSKAARFVTGDGIQLHGAIGFTEDYAVGHYYKRVVTNDALLGSGQHHLASYAGRLAERLIDEAR